MARCSKPGHYSGTDPCCHCEWLALSPEQREELRRRVTHAINSMLRDSSSLPPEPGEL